MRSRAVSSLCLTLVLVVTGSVSAELVGHWRLDEGTGSQAVDATGRGHNGTINGATWSNPGWNGKGTCLQFDGTNDVVVVPHADDLRFGANAAYTIAAWVNVTALPGHWAGVVTKGRETGDWYGIWINDGNRWVFGHQPNNQVGSAVQTGVWIHVVMVYDNSNKKIYLNGVRDSEVTASASGDTSGDLWFGAAKGVTEYAPVRIDDVRIYNHAAADAEIQKIMKGLADAPIAYDPAPEDGANDVPRDVALGWTAGEFAAAHDVYLGSSFEDVNDAGRTAPKDVLAGQDLTIAGFDPETLLEYGQTYYWRIDEINAAPDNAIFKGQVWSFTAEPYAYPISGVTATASSAQPGMIAENVVNGSGLNTDDQHSTESTQMWMTNGAKPAWIQFEFAKVEKLQEMWVWNSNQLIEAFIGFGAKNVTVEYSTDGVTWVTVTDVPEFARAIASATYTANTVVPFGGVLAKFVKLTINGNWGGVTPQTGLAEVRFFQIPVQAREPVPADDATDIALDAEFNWRPGREATSHKVFFGTDSAALAAAGTVTEHSFAPASMNFGTEYFWKVDEIGDTGTYEGQIWSFVSQEFAPIDDFEAYNDDDNRIYSSWVDGMTTGLNGSTVGYMQAPFAEQTIVRGKQSMPLAYDNSKSPYFSEATMELDAARNCTGNGATELCVWTRGYPAPAAVAVTETAGKMTLTGAGADIWNNSDEFTYAYKTLTGDGAMIARVTSNGTGTNTWAKGGVMIRDSLKGGSTHAMMVITGGGGNGASFQYRPVANAASSGNDSTAVLAVPYWIKIERQGDILIGSVSADGKTWSQAGQTTIAMEAPVLIGLCVTSHVAGTDRTFQFENVSTTGGVSGNWQGVVINTPEYNDPTGMYLIVKDSAGKTAMATSATAVNAGAWTRWVIPMSDLKGVNFAKIASVTIGVGNKTAPAAGSAGMVFIDDIGFGRSAAGQ